MPGGFLKKTIDDIPVDSRRVFVRVDFNVPFSPDGTISDDRRIRESLPTIHNLIGRGAVVILASHLGRPGGKVDLRYTLKPVADRLATLVSRPVTFIPNTVGPIAEEAVRQLAPGDVALLENVRFYPGEEKNDPAFSEQLANLADVFVNDAFGTAHRAHSSTVGIARLLPAVSGLLMAKELGALGGALESPRRPLVAIIGGAKISSKIGVLENLLPRVDSLLIGGGMANTFLKAQGLEIGRSLVEADQVGLARDIIARSVGKLVLPVDVVISQRTDGSAGAQTVLVDAVPADQLILDVGPLTVAAFIKFIHEAGTVIWNGPLGLAEVAQFSCGTLNVAQGMAASGATTIVGGGDLVGILDHLGVADRMSHVSTGGGASLEFLEGKILPGVAALEDR